jgi:hypothetical protein
MSDIPLHLQRRFEQRWAARFASPAASTVPKNVITKPATSLLTVSNETDLALVARPSVTKAAELSENSIKRQSPSA